MSRGVGILETLEAALMGAILGGTEAIWILGIARPNTDAVLWAILVVALLAAALLMTMLVDMWIYYRSLPRPTNGNGPTPAGTAR